MSYSFDGTNDVLTGTFTSSYASEPLTLACWVKVVTHPIAVDCLIQVGNSNTSQNDSQSIKTLNVDNAWNGVSINGAGETDSCQVDIDIDGVWAGIVATFSSSTLRSIYIQALANQDDGFQESILADLMKYISVGSNLAGSQDFGAASSNAGKLAEIAVWDAVLSDDDITSYLAGITAASIDASNLIGYWPLSASSGTQSNLGLDAGGDLTVSGATFSSDHPTITIPGASGRRRRTALMGMG
jgi:hypothetical protein